MPHLLVFFCSHCPKAKVFYTCLIILAAVFFTQYILISVPTSTIPPSKLNKIYHPMRINEWQSFVCSFLNSVLVCTPVFAVICAMACLERLEDIALNLVCSLQVVVSRDWRQITNLSHKHVSELNLFIYPN